MSILIGICQGDVWSVVTIAAVANIDIHQAITKMWTRLAGTLLGAAYAFLAVHYFAHHPVFKYEVLQFLQ